MTNKRLFLILFTSICTNVLCGQNLFKKNDVYFEFGGNGLLMSVNYERQLTSKPGVGIRLGVGFAVIAVNFPVSINYLIKINKKTSFIDAGMGITYFLATSRNRYWSDVTQLNFVPSIGFRHHPSKKTMFRISFATLIRNDLTYPVMGISCGIRF